jgi:hypothetical protein
LKKLLVGEEIELKDVVRKYGFRALKVTKEIENLARKYVQENYSKKVPQ